jgi:glucan phosphoethanolaminetransferase (alkaline phosphatase superfamily)
MIYRGRYDDSPNKEEHITGYFLLPWFYVQLVVELNSLLFSLCREGERLNYFKSVTTLMEWIRLTLLGIFTHWTLVPTKETSGNDANEPVKLVELIMILTFMSYFTLLTYLRWFRSFRLFFELLFASLASIGPFLVVLIIMLLSFTSAFWNINRNDPELLGENYCGNKLYNTIDTLTN